MELDGVGTETESGNKKESNFSKFIDLLGDFFITAIHSDSFWIAVFVIANIVMWIVAPFFIIGKLVITGLSLSIFGFIISLIFEEDSYMLLVLLGFVFVLSAAIGDSARDNVELDNPRIKSVIYYEPTNIIKNDAQLILVGKQHTVISDSLLLFTNKHPYICKYETYNMFHYRSSDKWGACIK